MKKLIIGILAIFSLTAYAKQQEVKMCEAAIKEILKAPTTYKQIEVSSKKKPVWSTYDLEKLIDMIYDESYWKFNKNPDTMQLTLRAKPEHHSINIKYQATNPFGVELAERAECNFLIIGKKQGFYEDIVGENNTFSLQVSGYALKVGVRKDYSVVVKSAEEL